MSLSSKSNTDAKPPCDGNACECHATVALDWQALSIRFDEEVFAADFAGWIENDLVALEGRLSQFASSSDAPRSNR